MGTGTPVCTKCKVLYEYRDYGIKWNCPVCDALIEDCDTGFQELSTEDRILYQDNSSEVRARKKREARECSLKR